MYDYYYISLAAFFNEIAMLERATIMRAAVIANELFINGDYFMVQGQVFSKECYDVKSANEYIAITSLANSYHDYYSRIAA